MNSTLGLNPSAEELKHDRCFQDVSLQLYHISITVKRGLEQTFYVSAHTSICQTLKGGSNRKIRKGPQRS